ncbi:hypothetical protein D3C71_1208750 [compost metagenome]
MLKSEICVAMGSELIIMDCAPLPPNLGIKASSPPIIDPMRAARSGSSPSAFKSINSTILSLAELSISNRRSSSRNSSSSAKLRGSARYASMLVAIYSFCNSSLSSSASKFFLANVIFFSNIRIRSLVSSTPSGNSWNGCGSART